MSIRLKLIVAGVILTGAISYLAFAGMKSGWVYYMEVDRFVTDQSARTQRVRLHGKVGQDHFTSSAATLTANFELLGDTQRVPIAYRGAIPEMFQTGRDVVVEGRIDPGTGVFHADVLMTKCASKYESASPHATQAGGSKAGQVLSPIPTDNSNATAKEPS